MSFRVLSVDRLTNFRGILQKSNLLKLEWAGSIGYRGFNLEVQRKQRKKQLQNRERWRPDARLKVNEVVGLLIKDRALELS